MVMRRYPRESDVRWTTSNESIPTPQRTVRLRILFLAGCVCIGAAAVSARLGWLTLVRTQELSVRAVERLDVERYLPSWRGRILDRKGRVLAEDVPSYDIAVTYPFATGEWVRRKAEESARREAGRAAWRAMDAPARDEAIARHADSWRARESELMRALSKAMGISERDLESRLAEIVSATERRASAVWARQRQRRIERGEPADRAPEPIREMVEPHVLVEGVPDALAFEMRRLADSMPGGVEVIDSTRRHYPWSSIEVEVARDALPGQLRASQPMTLRIDGALDFVVGSMRGEVWQEDLERRPFERRDADGMLDVDLGGYRAGRDAVGARGVERSAEDALRGLRGFVRRRVDTGSEERTEPVPGRDVSLSVDAALQARVQAAIDPRVGLTRVQQWHAGWRDGQPRKGPLPLGEPLAAAAVVIDVATGDVLAMASTPTPAMAPGMSEGERLRRDPFIDRAAGGIYPPGSILKPIVYLAAVKEGACREDEAFACNGHYFPGQPDVARCWIYRPQYGMATHSQRVGGPLSIEQSLARSCNITFYTLAARLGSRRMTAWYRDFGLGDAPGSGLGREVTGDGGSRRIVGEAAGSLPSAELLDRLDSRGDAFTTILLGIGQGPLAWSPLQAANAYAAMARGGVWMPPRLLREGAGPVQRPSRDLALSDSSVRRALEGLRRSVAESYGTGHHVEVSPGVQEPVVSVPGVRVWAKTGTAQSGPLRVDIDEDGQVDTTITDADHAWFVGLAGNDRESRPSVAVAVLVEHGGGGGRTAGPVAAAVIRALADEGYLGTSRSRPVAGPAGPSSVAGTPATRAGAMAGEAAR
jgi:penicillin-binding protein 2